MSSPRFINRALSFWPTRFIARRQASELFDLVSGFVYSQVLSAAVRLQLFDVLKQPKTLTTICAETGLSATAAKRLLRATTALKLTRDLPAHHYGLARLGNAMIGNEGLQALVAHHDMLYCDLSKPASIFTDTGSTSLGEYWAYSRADQTTTDHTTASEVSDYSNLMAASQPMISEQVLQSYSFSRHHSVMDVGGGTGRFLQAVRQRYPILQLGLFDLPAVSEVRDCTHQNQLNIEQHTGDFLHDRLPVVADLITLVRILHDHNDAAVMVLLKNIYHALPDRGSLLIAEPMSDGAGAERVGEAYFNVYFLAMGKGEPRSSVRLKSMLYETGFTEVRVINTRLPLLCTVMTAQKNT
ncbi:MAG: methyltransferase [Pseudomonadota bacterium]